MSSGEGRLLRRSWEPGNREAAAAVQGVRKVAVAGLGRGCGVSFVAGLLAGVAVERGWASVAFAELGTPCFYEALGMEKRFFHRNFQPFYRFLKEGENPGAIDNEEGGIRWLLRCPPALEGTRDFQPLSLTDRLRLIHNARGSLRLLDCSGLEDEALWELLPELDRLIVVADPLPSRLLPRAGMLDRLSAEPDKCLLVVNKMNKGVQARELKRFLGGLRRVELPYLPPEDRYRAEYRCQLPYDLPQLRRQVEAPLELLWEDVESLPAALVD